MVMHRGTAGPVAEDRQEATITQPGDCARILLVTSRARLAWVEPSYQVMAAVVPRHDNVVLADRRAYSDGKAGWFKDGLHLTERGKPYFANVINKPPSPAGPRGSVGHELDLVAVGVLEVRRVVLLAAGVGMAVREQQGPAVVAGLHDEVVDLGP